MKIPGTFDKSMFYFIKPSTILADNKARGIPPPGCTLPPTKNKFSIFDENPIQLITPKETISLNIEHPENIQLYHVKAMKNHLDGIKEHPSTGETALHTAWIMDNILGRSFSPLKMK